MPQPPSMNDPDETAAPGAGSDPRLVVIRYGNLYDLAANTYTGRILAVGEEVTLLRREGAYLYVREALGNEGHLLPTRVSARDPRQYFEAERPPLRGYLIDGMYDDTSGGSLESLTLTDVEVFGELVLDARVVDGIRVVGGAQPHEVTTRDGAVYRGRAPKLWLATPTMRINLSKASSLSLRRA